MRLDRMKKFPGFVLNITFTVNRAILPPNSGRLTIPSIKSAAARRKMTHAHGLRRPNCWSACMGEAGDGLPVATSGLRAAEVYRAATARHQRETILYKKWKRWRGRAVYHQPAKRSSHEHVITGVSPLGHGVCEAARQGRGCRPSLA